MVGGDTRFGSGGWLRRFVLVHTAIVLIWGFLVFVWRDGHWTLQFVNQFGPAVFVWSTAVAVVVAVLGRRIGLTAVAALPFFLLAGLYLPYLLPGTSVATDDAALRVMTFNILNNNMDLDAVAGVIVESAADIVAIQEVRNERADELLALVAETYPYAVVAPPARGGTTALVSTRPFVAEGVLDPGVDRPIAVGTVDVAGRRVTVMSAHLIPNYYALRAPLMQRSGALATRLADHQQEAEAIVADVADRSGLIIVACDCNTTDLNRTNRILADVFDDPIRELGRPRGEAPSGMEHERRRNHLDYVWYRPTDGVAALGAYRIVDRAGSDHHAIVVDFGFEDAP